MLPALFTFSYFLKIGSCVFAWSGLGSDPATQASLIVGMTGMSHHEKLSG
jgi:hypothetical protein